MLTNNDELKCSYEKKLKKFLARATPTKKKKFLQELAIALNMIDIKLVEEIYYRFIKFIARETKKRGSLRLPDFGVFSIYKLKKKFAGRNLVISGKVIKFKRDYKLYQYMQDKKIIE